MSTEVNSDLHAHHHDLRADAALLFRSSDAGWTSPASARAFALGTADADALIACWRSKYDENYWRPITATREADTDGNPTTAPDPGWTPLLATSPYPDYPSGHACITGAATGVLSPCSEPAHWTSSWPG